MRHGRRAITAVSASISGQSPATTTKPPFPELRNVLVVASLSKTLSQSGTRNLDANSIPISEPVVLEILRRNSIDPTKKLDFFRWCFSLRPDYKHSVSAYSQIFRTVSRATGLLGEIPDLLGSMKEDEVKLDESTYKVLLDSLIRSGKFDSALGVLDYLGDCVNPSLYDSVLTALVKKHELRLALSIFFKLLEDDSHSYLPGNVAVNELLVSLRKSKMRSEFKRVFEMLKSLNRFEFDTWTYNICIHGFGCYGDLDTALCLFKEMKEKKTISPDICTYNTLIQALCLSGKAKDALIVWEELQVSGHEPDNSTYRILIQGCCKSYLIDDAMRIFSEMEYNGFVPDTIVYNSLLDGTLKARKVTEACELFEKMVREGVRASCWTYNILINGLFRNGRAEAGFTLFCDLKKKGQYVDAVTFSIVVLQLCREGKLEEAVKLVEEMETRGFVVDLVTISSLLIGFHKQGRWDWKEKLMKHVRGNLVPNVLRWNAGVEAELKRTQSKDKDYTPMFPSKGSFVDIVNMVNSEEEEEEEVTLNEDMWSSSPYMDRLAHKRNPTKPLFGLNRGQRVKAKPESFDVDMMNTFLSIYLSSGDLSLSCKLFEIFSEMGIGTDFTSYTYNSITSSFVKRGHYETAKGVLDQMGSDIFDIATYNSIIQGLGKLGRADLATAVLSKLENHGGYIDIVMYNTLINTLGKANRLDEAVRLFDHMKKTNGLNPDVVSYNTMIEVHSKAGKLKEAYKYLKMMLDANVLPNHVTDTILDFLGREMEKSRI